MKIVIDARMYGLEHAGIGRYVMNLVDQLQVVDKDNHYTLLIRQRQAEKFEIRNSKFEITIVDIPHYSFKEQIELSKILNKLDCNIAHFPHFNVPLFFNQPFVVTIHDLIKHTSRGMETTTRNQLLYWLKYFGYKMVFGSAVRQARKIIVPSNVIKDELLKEYQIPPGKVMVIYEGVDDAFKSEIRNPKPETILKKYKITKPYVVYTGSAYPHKNLERLIEAIKFANGLQTVDLIICSSRNVFLDRLQEVVKRDDMQDSVHFLGFVQDQDLAVLYKNAKAFVFPSLSEGFGLPGLEAMSSGTPVVCSDIPVFHEIYSEAAIYFDPYDVKDMAEKINDVLQLDDSSRQNIIKKGKTYIQQFSWRKMAEETLRVYKDILDNS